ncbi:MAG: M56 family metallopeptidase [Steroidobacteraceae bacterium]
MNNSMLPALANHLWQSTLFAIAVGVLALLLRNNSARIRYSLWLIASLKFLLPFSLLTALGVAMSQSLGFTQEAQPSIITVAVQNAAQITQIASLDLVEPVPLQQGGGQGASPGLFDVVVIALGILWVIGALAISARWLARWIHIRRALRQSTASELSFVIPVRLSASQLEPGVVGIVRPVLLMPAGIDKKLTAEQMRAVLAHEQCHLAWRDNLAGALHMLVEALFWFHPLIWWIGRKLIDERERACDEYVIAAGHARESYAEGILNVCEQYLKLQLPCVSGMSGAELRQRMEDIMKMQLIERLTGVRKLLLSAAAAIAIAAPIAVGVLTAPSVNAQATSGAAEITFKNVSIRLATIDQDNGRRFIFSPAGLDARDISLRAVIAAAYAVNEEQVTGRDWANEPHYNISALMDGPASSQPGGAAVPPPNAQSGVLQARNDALKELLVEHFGLVARVEKKPLNGYALLLGTGESKLELSSADSLMRVMSTAVGISATRVPLSEVAKILSRMLSVPVTDQTGLKGNFDFELKWESSGKRPDSAEIAKTLQQQLGLKLEARPVTTDVVNVVSLKSSAEAVNTVPVNDIPVPSAPNIPASLQVQVPDLATQKPLKSAQIVGVYDGGGNTDVDIVDVGGKLYRRLPPAADKLLMQTGVNRYKPEGKDGITITFFEKDGSVHLLLDLQGAKFVLDKKSS